MNIEAFNAYKQEQSHALQELEEMIASDQKRVKEVEQNYKNLIIEGKNDEADRLFIDMEALKARIKRNSYRLSVKQSTTNEATLEQALKTVVGIKEVRNEYQERLNELDNKATTLLDELYTLMQEATRLKQAYNVEKQPYEQLIDRYDISSIELSKQGLIGANGTLRNDLKAFEKNDSRLPKLVRMIR